MTDKAVYLPDDTTIEKLRSLVASKHAEQAAIEAAANAPKLPFKREVPRVGRNDPCPCGSGKKYKKCHLGKENELS